MSAAARAYRLAQALLHAFHLGLQGVADLDGVGRLGLGEAA
jgi:hypothetical protein